MRSTFLLSLVAFAAVAGCGDHGVPSPDDLSMSSDDMSASLDMSIPNDAKHVVTFTQFAADYAQALCAHEMACGQLDAAQMAACIERNTLHSGWDQDVEIMKGRMVINDLQCLNALKNSRCDGSDFIAWASQCEAFLYTGNQAAGAPCIGSQECQTGLYCQHAGSDAGMIEQVSGCPGTCAPVKVAGDSCRIGSDCKNDSYCDFRVTHKCIALGALHDPCTNILGVGTGQPCQYGLTCPTFAASPTCEIPSMATGAGDACDPYQGQGSPTPACAAGMYCQVQYTATTTACTGAPTDCGSVVGGYCNVGTGFCQQPTAGKCAAKIAAGADCDPNNESFFSFAESQCADGSICAQYTGQTKATCQAFRGASASCRGDTDCKVGFYCDGTSKCAPWLTDHASCTNANAQTCTSQICVAQNADAGGAMTCEAPKNFGASCVPVFEDNVCAAADLPASSECAANASGTSGTCAPKCF